jgi:hypothetical protein
MMRRERLKRGEEEDERKGRDDICFRVRAIWLLPEKN